MHEWFVQANWNVRQWNREGRLLMGQWIFEWLVWTHGRECSGITA
jgi:hypothetical protein